MCLIVFSLNPDKKHKFILSANRDEFYERPTEEMHWWDTSPRILAGKDKSFNGAWMGINDEGRFAAVTNVREFTELSLSKYKLEDLNTRGDLVKDFLLSSVSAKDYIKRIDGLKFQGFNLLLYDGKEACLSSNKGIEITFQEHKVYAIGNKPFNQKSKKIMNVEKDFQQIISETFNSRDLINLMKSPRSEPLKFSEEYTRENHGREFPDRFIVSDIYGTRSTSSLIMDRSKSIFLEEQSFSNFGEESITNTFEFKY